MGLGSRVGRRWSDFLDKWRKKNKPVQAPGAERRESVRYGISLETSCRLLAMVQDDPIPVRVRNISRGGISLVVHKQVESGTLLDIELLNRPNMVLSKLQVKITYSVEHPSGDWILGGAFVEKMSDSDIQALLA